MLSGAAALLALLLGRSAAAPPHIIFSLVDDLGSYNVGWRNANATSPNILPHMYPITVRELHAGWIVGDERIITLHSGRFGWGASASSGNGSSAVMHCVDESGHSVARAVAVAKAARGNVWFNVEVPLGGVCVLVRPSV